MNNYKKPLLLNIAEQVAEMQRATQPLFTGLATQVAEMQRATQPLFTGLATQVAEMQRATQPLFTGLATQVSAMQPVFTSLATQVSAMQPVTFSSTREGNLVRAEPWAEQFVCSTCYEPSLVTQLEAGVLRFACDTCGHMRLLHP